MRAELPQSAKIRHATEADLPEIARIHAQTSRSAYAHILSASVLAGITPAARLASWEQWWAAGSHQVDVLACQDQLLGFVRTSPPQDVAQPPTNFGELSHLYIDAGFIGQGIGQHLFDHAQQILRAQGYQGMLLWTLEANHQARKFYARNDMHCDGARAEDPDWLGPGIFEIRYLLSWAIT